MRTNDQWFEPGDKVMRVSSGCRNFPAITCDVGIPQYGQVYCVEDFWEGPIFNAVILIGFGGWRYHPRNGSKVGWEACAFRRVSEIKLCVEAVSKSKAPKVQPVESP